MPSQSLQAYEYAVFISLSQSKLAPASAKIRGMLVEGVRVANTQLLLPRSRLGNGSSSVAAENHASALQS